MLTMIAVLVAGLSAAQGTETATAVSEKQLNSLVDLLGREVPPAKKQEASRKLVEAGKAGIPLLIAALRDQRPYGQRDAVNRMNLPGFENPPKRRMVTISVGSRCLDLLYEIITPAGSFASGNFKVFSEQKLQVDDWNAWWSANRHKSLGEIHMELTPLVDEYWKRHGTTQNVRDRQEPAEWEHGFPIPKGARGNDSAGGATTRGPGANYVLKAYDLAAGLPAIIAFYDRHLRGAQRSSEGEVVLFSKSGGSVRLTPSGQGTRITLTLGPQ
jgi:hypothetical protein